MNNWFKEHNAMLGGILLVVITLAFVVQTLTRDRQVRDGVIPAIEATRLEISALRAHTTKKDLILFDHVHNYADGKIRRDLIKNEFSGIVIMEESEMEGWMEYFQREDNE